MLRLFPYIHALSVLALLLALTQPAIAQTYYIDAKLGNDGYTGDSPDKLSANRGPWQSFANVSGRNTLSPGDTVLLRCGQTWSETLTLRSSGTAEAPIRVGSYPLACADKPAIDGSKRIPASAWTLHSGNIYKTKLPAELMINGDFATKIEGWRKWSAKNDAVMAISNTCPDSTTACLAFTSGSSGSSLLISNPIELIAGARYRVKLSIRAPSGMPYEVAARRFSPPWDTLGLVSVGYKGNNAWQDVEVDFVAKDTVNNGRIDIQISQPSKTVYVKDVHVTNDETSPEALVLVRDRKGIINPAHHPNRGFKPLTPDSPYLSTGASSATITTPEGRKASEYLVTGSDLVLPSGATILPGHRVVLRSQAWSLFEHTVKSVSGNRIYLDPVTPYPLQHTGWGYYLTGALWMLDSPGEWHYDAASQTLYVWAESGHPGEDIFYSTLKRGLDIGLDVYPAKHIVVDNIAFRNARDALYVQRAENAALRDIDVSNAARYGIEAEGTINLELSNSRIAYTGSDGLHGPASNGAVVTENDLSYIGVQLDTGDIPKNLPLPNYGALYTGSNATVSGNRLSTLAYIGITAGSNSNVSENGVANYCFLLSDCAGIYLGGVANSVVEGNLVTGGLGNRLGTPTGLSTLVDSLYLDGSSHDVTVSDNVLDGGDYAIQLHDGHDNKIERNTLYGSRSNLLWLQETGNSTRATGNIFGNQIQDNHFFQTNSASTLRHVAKVGDASDFATYSGNIYSTLISPVIAVENTQAVNRSYQFKDWQSAVDANGASRNLDPDGRVAAPLAGYARGLLGNTLVVNGTLTDGTVGWSRYNATAPAATLAVVGCLPTTERCALLTAGGSNTSLSTPRFDVVQGQWYRVSFDAQVGQAGLNLKIQAIQSGPTSYASVMGAEPLVYNGSTTLKRYSFVFQSTATVQRSATSAGVRVDFMDVKPGETLRVANFEVVPLNVAGNASSHTLLSNSGRTDLSVLCPTETSAPAQCDSYYRFPQGDQLVWPLLLAPLEAQAVFVQDTSLLDADGDGVANSQDWCASTPTNAATNAKGCALGQ